MSGGYCGRASGIHEMKNTIKVERAKKNWTQADLAQRVGVSRQAVNAVETGKFIPSTVLALKMALAFGTTVDQVFQLEEADGMVEI
jgi:putative transcriptional regulator